MFHEEEILDDLLNNVFEELLNLPFNIQTSRGISSEQIGALLVLKNPRARLSRTETKGKPFSALGELLWYLAGSNDLNFIKYYIQFYEEEELWEEDSKGEKVIYGGYGPRFFDTRGHNQFRNIIDLLKESPNARRAVIQLFDADDLAQKHKDIPCTCTMQFMIRNGELNMYTNMRSNDAFLGLPHDVFAFTMIQEIVARSLEIKLGTYYHAVGSLHLYKKHRKKARQYLNEGLQSTKAVSIHKDECDPELMFQDYEDIPSTLIGESWISENLWKFMALEEDEKEPFMIYIGNLGGDPDNVNKIHDDFQECYAGNWDELWSDTRRNFAENLFDEIYEVPENIQHYIDYQKFSNDLFMSDYWEVDGHVFRNL